MAGLWAIWRREVQSYFASPVAYVVLAFFIFLYGYFFNDYLFIFVDRGLGRGGFGPTEVLNVNEDLIRWLVHSTGVLVLFLLPLVTMRAFSEEIRSGTIELMLTSPVSDLVLVLGKFLGAMTLYAAMLGLTTVHMGILFLSGDPEWKPVAVGYLGMLLLGGSFIAVGLVFSSLTRNQVVAGFLSFGTFLFLWLIEYAESWAGSLSGLVTFLSVTKHVENFAKGVLDSRDVLYYLSFIVFGLFLTRQSVDSLRWRG